MFARVSVFLAALLGLLGVASLAAETKIRIAPDRERGVYAAGEPVTWNVTVDPPADGAIRFELREGGLDSSSRLSAELENGAAHFTATRTNPGTMLVAVGFKPSGEEKETVAYGGAVFAWRRIVRSAPPPADFDEFWQSKLAELHAVGVNAQVERVDIGDPAIEYYKLTMDNIRGSKIHGHLAKPAGMTDLPASLQVQWAGVYPLQRDWPINYARQGWLALNISAHDLPIDQPDAYYAEKAKHELDDYPGQGAEDRETSYFLRMFLSCRRAVDFLTERADWNRQTLVVHGASQGGYQSLVAAGLCPAVTAMAANVPAGCDHTGKQAGRAPGWPNWASRVWQGKNEAKMLETARYFDAINFAPRIKCPSLVGVGLADTVCPSEGVIAAFNEIAGPKTLVIMPTADHGGDHAAYFAAFNKFMEEQKNGGRKTPAK